MKTPLGITLLLSVTSCEKRIEEVNLKVTKDPIIGYWEHGFHFKENGTCSKTTDDKVFHGEWRRRSEILWLLECSDVELRAIHNSNFPMFSEDSKLPPIYEFSITKPEKHSGTWKEVTDGGMYETKWEGVKWEDGIKFELQDGSLIQNLDCYSNHYKRLKEPNKTAEQDAAPNH